MEEVIENITPRPKKQTTKKVFKIPIEKEQSPYLKLQAKNIEERKAMRKKLKFSILLHKPYWIMKWILMMTIFLTCEGEKNL